MEHLFSHLQKWRNISLALYPSRYDGLQPRPPTRATTVASWQVFPNNSPCSLSPSIYSPKSSQHVLITNPTCVYSEHLSKPCLSFSICYFWFFSCVPYHSLPPLHDQTLLATLWSIQHTSPSPSYFRAWVGAVISAQTLTVVWSVASRLRPKPRTCGFCLGWRKM